MLENYSSIVMPMAVFNWTMVFVASQKVDSSSVTMFTAIAAGVIIPILYLMQHFTFSNRQVQMRSLANELGFEYLSAIPLSQLGSISTSRLLKKTDNGRVVNFMFGQTDQARIQIFDFEYPLESRRFPQTNRQTVVAMMFTGLQLAPCRVYPESVFNFFGELLGDQDINFEDHPEFSSRFVVQSHNADEVREMFDRQLMDFFCQDPDLNFEATRTAFLLYSPNKTLGASAIRAKMADAYALYQELLESQSRRPKNPAIQYITPYAVEGNEATC